MAVAVAPTLRIRPGYRGLLALARALGIELAPFQRDIARLAFGPEREAAAIVPRGHGKTTVSALLALHTLATAPGETVAVGSTSRGQAALLHAMLEEFAAHPALNGRLTILAVQGDRPAARFDGGGVLSVISGRGSRAVGRTDRLMLVDEAWALQPAKRQGDDLLGALQTSMAKSRDGTAPRGRLLVISTAAPRLDGPLGQMRARALAGQVTRRAGRIDACVPGVLRWLEWSVPEDRSLDDLRAVKLANPAPWVTLDVIAEAKARCAPLDFAQHHANRWGVGEGVWLPPGAWSACAVPGLRVADGAEVWLGVDIGGARSASAVVAVDAELRVAAVEVFTGTDAVLAVTDAVRALCDRFTVREIAFDPWRWTSEAQRLERDGFRQLVEFPQSTSRMTAASEGLHAAIVEQRLQHPGHPTLDRHVANAIARPTGRGWRLDTASDEGDLPVDAAIALAMAVDRAGAAEPRHEIKFYGLV